MKTRFPGNVYFLFFFLFSRRLKDGKKILRVLYGRTSVVNRAPGRTENISILVRIKTAIKQNKRLGEGARTIAEFGKHLWPPTTRYAI